MQRYLTQVKEIMGEFEECAMEYIPWEQNSRTDLLLILASTRIVINNRSIIQEVIEEPSISGATPLMYALWNRSRVSNNPIWECLTIERLRKEERKPMQ